jgi:hypothetical protein
MMKRRRTQADGDRRQVRNKKKPFKALTDRKLANDQVLKPGELFSPTKEESEVDFLEDPYTLEFPEWPPTFTFEKPYEGARYELAIPTDFSQRETAPQKVEHPHKARFVKRKVRKAFPHRLGRGKTEWRTIDGVVQDYNWKRGLFRIKYSDDSTEDMDFEQLQEILIMGRQYGDSKEDWGRTRDETAVILEHGSIQCFVEEELRCQRIPYWEAMDAQDSHAVSAVDAQLNKESGRSPRLSWAPRQARQFDIEEGHSLSRKVGNRFGEEEPVELQSPAAFTTSTVGSSTGERNPGDGIEDTHVPPKYGDEPRTAAEVLIHPERDDIEAAARKEMQQLKDTQTGVYPSEKDIADIKRRGLKILRSKMVYQRKYENYTGRDGKVRERFLKWKARLAVIGTGEVLGVDTVWSTFSPTIGFAAIRLIISLMCDPAYDVRSYDLSGAFLGTDLKDRSVYVRLPADAGSDDAGKIIRLMKACYGLKSSSSEFVKQLSREILNFDVDQIGLKWRLMGEALPEDAQLLQNRELAAALQHKLEFTRQEWASFKVANLRTNQYVQVGTAYYQPVFGSFRQLATDHCIYVYEGTGGEKIILAHYVDDIICATNAPEVRERFFAHLNKTWKITDEGTLDRFVGVHFERSEDKRSWKASLGGYIDRVAQRFDLLDAKLADTPMDPGFVLTPKDLDEEPTEESKSLYRSLIGSIGFIATAVRFDISYAVSVLSRHLSRPNSKLIEAAKRVIRYLRKTRDQGIEWSCSKEEAAAGTNNKLFGSVDASYANCQLTRRSHGGYIMFLNHGCVSWKSGLQPIVTLSSCEAEYVALCSAVCEVKYLRALLDDLGYPQDEATLIWEDNKAAIMIAENESSSAGRCKHIDVRFRFVAEAIRNEQVRIRYCPTSFNYADIMTKALTPAKFAELYAMCVESKSLQFANRPISSDEGGRNEERAFLEDSFIIYV